MKQQITPLLLTAALALSAGWAGCTKCVECSYEVASHTRSSGNVCGTDEEIEQVKDDWQQQAQNNGTNATCIEG